MGHFGGLASGQFAYGKVATCRPGQVQCTAGSLVFGGQIEKRRQQAARFDRPCAHELGNRQHLDTRLLGLQRDAGQRAVGGAQVDADDVFRCHASFLLAGLLSVA